MKTAISRYNQLMANGFKTDSQILCVVRRPRCFFNVHLRPVGSVSFTCFCPILIQKSSENSWKLNYKSEDLTKPKILKPKLVQL